MSIFIILITLLTPICFQASVVIEQQTQPEQLPTKDTQVNMYVSEGAIIHGEEFVYNAKIVNVPKSLKSSTLNYNKVAAKKIVKEISKPKQIIITKIATPTHFFAPLKSNENFLSSNGSSGKNFITVSNFSLSKVVSHHFTILSIPEFAYLLKFYKADFSKTAELSQFLFSRPPPQSIA